MKGLKKLLLKNTHNFIILCCALLLTNRSFSQSWVEMMQDPYVNFYDVQKAFNNYWEDTSKIVYVETYNVNSKSLAFEKKMPGWKVFKRWENQMQPRLYPTGDFSVMREAMKDYFNASDADQNRINTKNLSERAANWSYCGPTTIPSDGGGAGRINFIRFNPTNSKIIYVGAPTGGLWKSADGGVSWSTNTDNLAVIGCTDLAIHPTKNQIMYLATGDQYSDKMYSNGVLKTTDGGTTWNPTGLNLNVNNSKKIGRLLMNPKNPNTIFAATTDGIYCTRNAGVLWKKVSTITNFLDIEFKPNDTMLVYACTQNKFYKSTNGGASFKAITSGVPASASVNTLSIAVSEANPAYVYILASGNNGPFYGLYRSTDSGTKFKIRSNSPNLLGYSITGTDAVGQGWYDLALAVSPKDAEHVVVGGINIWSSTNGGAAWSNKSHWNASSTAPNYVHADIHSLEFLPGSNTTYFAGCDGGLFKTTKSGSVWSDLSNGLQIGQLYRLGNSATSSDYFLSGLQDNGANRFDGSSWTRAMGGDGMECIIDWSNENVQYASLQNGEIRKTVTGENFYSSIVSSNGTGVDEQGAWTTPFVQSATNAGTLFVGKTQVYKCTDGGYVWTKIDSIGDPYSKIVALVNAPSNENYIYAVKANKIYASTNGTTFTNVTGTLPTSSAAIVSIVVHPTNPNKIWITFSGYSSGNKVFYSPNAGTTWTNYSTGLPNLPINCVVYDKSSTNDALYVGADIGVYYRDNTLSSWVLYNTGLPNVIINELEIQYMGGKLRAATYGRGAWQTSLYAAKSASLDVSTIDFDNKYIIYPNPTDGSFTFSFSASFKSNYTIEIQNSIGQKIYQEEIKNAEGTYSKQVNLKEYGKGVYFFNIVSEEKRVVKKIVVN